jgi:hypothetical protein
MTSVKPKAFTAEIICPGLACGKAAGKEGARQAMTFSLF